jgi:hypothetical protein
MQEIREAVAEMKREGVSKAARRRIAQKLLTSNGKAVPGLKAGQAYVSIDGDDEGRRVVTWSKKEGKFGLVNVDTGRVSLAPRSADELTTKIANSGFVYAGESVDDIE